ncbi:MAG: DUF2934 domain-containing protein [Nitrospirae bacterium]|nr:DUF2934 domain-containing protein [Nitrospirota bacterium]
MSKETVLNRATPTMSAGTSYAGLGREKTGAAEQTSKGARAHDRIARRAYELYEQGGRQDGRALEDWLKAERQLVGAASHS